MYYTGPNRAVTGRKVSADLHKMCLQRGFLTIRDSFEVNRRCVYFYEDTPELRFFLFNYICENKHMFESISCLSDKHRKRIVPGGDLSKVSITETRSRKNLVKRLEKLKQAL